VLASSTNALAHSNEAWDGPTAIGADSRGGSGRVFPGKIDEVSVYNYTLSPAEVADLYRAALLGGPVVLRFQAAATHLVLNWDHGTLLSAPGLDGPWTAVPGAAPPSFSAAPGAPVFYRVRVSP
jgi:Concanavalin A-like lectin/glucanases superfamily